VSATAIRLEHLGKRYGRLTALKDVSLDVLPGEGWLTVTLGSEALAWTV